METTKQTPADALDGRTLFFDRKAESLRKQLLDVEDKLTEYRGYAKAAKDAGKPVGKQLQTWLVHYGAQQRQLRKELDKALYHRGRR